MYIRVLSNVQSHLCESCVAKILQDLVTKYGRWLPQQPIWGLCGYDCHMLLLCVACAGGLAGLARQPLGLAAIRDPR